MSRSIRVVFFDAADTLFHVHGSVAEMYLHHAVQFGFRQKPDSVTEIAQAFRRAFQEAPPPVFAVIEPAQLKQSERLWWFDIVHHVFYRVGMFERFDEFFDQVFHAFEDHRSWRLFPETTAILAQLKARDLELGIISNFDSRLFTVMRGLGIADSFDTVTISSWPKQQNHLLRFFRIALEKHAIDPEEALHVGDSLREDVEGATKAGLQAVLLDRKGPKRQEEVPVISSLEELFPLLARFEQ
ncbi:MAG: HAD-IA family hydrolase [Nitrospira sp.]|nr:HAD-IA family hydrolase [Nitrospira sp.]